MNEKIKRISFEKAKYLLDTNPQCILLDVREESEFYVMHADGAQSFPVDSINEETAKEVITRFDTPVIVYCKTGARALLASQKLISLGYKNVYDLGSLVDWPYGMGYGAW